MNLVVLSGRLVKEPEVSYAAGMSISRFTLAVDRRFKKDGEPSADFINCIAFGKTAEFVEKYVSKGLKVNVQGRWQTGSYIDKNNNKVYTHTCMVDSIEPCEKFSVKTQASDDGFLNVADGIDDELPFN